MLGCHVEGRRVRTVRPANDPEIHKCLEFFFGNDQLLHGQSSGLGVDRGSICDYVVSDPVLEGTVKGERWHDQFGSALEEFGEFLGRG